MRFDTYIIDLVFAQGVRRRNRLVEDLLELAALGVGRGDSHGNHEENEFHLYGRQGRTT